VRARVRVRVGVRVRVRARVNGFRIIGLDSAHTPSGRKGAIMAAAKPARPSPVM
jgi:hypothetical protein